MLKQLSVILASLTMVSCGHSKDSAQGTRPQVNLAQVVKSKSSTRYTWHAENNTGIALTPSDYKEIYSACIDEAPTSATAVARVTLDLSLLPGVPFGQEVLQLELSAQNPALSNPNEQPTAINYLTSASIVGGKATEYSAFPLRVPKNSKNICFKIYGWPIAGAPFLSTITLKDIDISLYYDNEIQ